MNPPTVKDLHQTLICASFGLSEDQILKVLDRDEMCPELAAEIEHGASLSDGKSLYRRAVEDGDVHAAIEFMRQNDETFER